MRERTSELEKEIDRRESQLSKFQEEIISKIKEENVKQLKKLKDEHMYEFKRLKDDQELAKRMLEVINRIITTAISPSFTRFSLNNVS